MVDTKGNARGVRLVVTFGPATRYARGQGTA